MAIREAAHLLSDNNFAFESISSDIQMLLNKVSIICASVVDFIN